LQNDQAVSDRSPAKPTADEAVADLANQENNERDDEDDPADGQQDEGHLVQNPEQSVVLKMTKDKCRSQKRSHF
jgi:hypothetical protein